MSDVEKLARVKLKLEREKEELLERIREIEDLIQLVDEKLKGISYITAEDLIEEKTQEVKPEERVEAEPSRTIQLLRVGDKNALTAEVTETTLNLQVDPSFNVSLSSRPIKYLLKTCDTYIEEDYKLIQEGSLRREEKLSYSVEEEGGNLQSLKVHNYRSDERMRDIMGKAKWAVRTIIRESSDEV
ncbi:MAG: hypothetical protein GTN80_01520 [Nitrososphaeria archaeon]|nr:hypothetical protein [Nitrososphaeria archaeon]NIN51796.1 hypothetical protein [Nitrososphaeria archaeon]NIQ32320.1 hypothetical protein [Nitrososphaeria archaeon]